jgi:mycothiol system anti-sigma-R factor
MVCDDVKRAVYFFLDGSLAAPKQHDFTEHLSLCPDCDRRTRVHRRLRIFVLARLKPESAPDRLKQRLARAFRAMGAEWS